MLVDEEDEELLVGWEDAEGVLGCHIRGQCLREGGRPQSQRRADSRGLELKRFFGCGHSDGEARLHLWVVGACTVRPSPCKR